MARPSDPMLAWLRKLVDARGLNAAQLAKKAGLEKARVRKLLVGAEPMLVDELVQISNALELSATDMGLPGGVGEEPAAPGQPRVVADEAADPEALPAPTGPVVDPWGNHPEQLFRIGFALGCDFFFLARAAELEGSGVPAHVIAQYPRGEVPIRLDAQFHEYNKPRYDDHGVTIALSFDALYDCRFPWASIQQITFFPAPPQAARDEEPPAPKGSHLRLVT